MTLALRYNRMQQWQPDVTSLSYQLIVLHDYLQKGFTFYCSSKLAFFPVLLTFLDWVVSTALPTAWRHRRFSLRSETEMADLARLLTWMKIPLYIMKNNLSTCRKKSCCIIILYCSLYIVVVIDLVDMEGQVTNLPGRAKEYANEIVTARGIYILIRVERKCYT